MTKEQKKQDEVKTEIEENIPTKTEELKNLDTQTLVDLSKVGKIFGTYKGVIESEKGLCLIVLKTGREIIFNLDDEQIAKLEELKEKEILMVYCGEENGKQKFNIQYKD